LEVRKEGTNDSRHAAVDTLEALSLDDLLCAVDQAPVLRYSPTRILYKLGPAYNRRRGQLLGEEAREGRGVLDRLGRSDGDDRLRHTSSETSCKKEETRETPSWSASLLLLKREPKKERGGTHQADFSEQ
jgi:hypothetical protein